MRKKKFVIGEHEIYHKLATINLIHKRRWDFHPFQRKTSLLQKILRFKDENYNN